MNKTNRFRALSALLVGLLLLCLVPFTSATAPATIQGQSRGPDSPEAATLSIGSGNVEPGGSITVPLSTSLGTENLGAATIQIQYDPDVVNATNCVADPGGVLDTALCNENQAANQVAFTAISAAGVSGDVVLAEVTFQAVGTAGESSDLTLTASTFADPAGQPLNPTLQNGQIAINENGEVINVVQGWNSVALRLAPLPTAEEALDQIAGQNGNCDMVCRWLSDIDNWQCHTKDRPYNGFALELGRGYFFRCSAASTWTRSGSPPASAVPVDLEPIWTFIGLPALTSPMTARDLLDGATAQGGACTEIHRWYAGDWDGFSTSMGGPGFDLANNEGYFVKCANAIRYTPGGSTQ